MKEIKITVPWEKTVDKNWAGVWSLPIMDGDATETPQPVVAVIDRAVFGEDIKVAGRSDSRMIAHFKPGGYVKVPILLNKTNMKRLSKLTGSRVPEKWANTCVILRQEMDRTPSGGRDWALRISESNVGVKPEDNGKIVLSVSSPNFESIKKWLTNGEGTIEAIEKKYFIELGAKKELERCSKIKN